MEQYVAPAVPPKEISVRVTDGEGAMASEGKVAAGSAALIGPIRGEAAQAARGIPSDGPPGMRDSAVGSSGPGGQSDAVLSVGQVRPFEPDPRVHPLAVGRLGQPAEAIAFRSSSAWDAHAAAAFGTRAAWCDRCGRRGRSMPGTPVREARSMAEPPTPLAP